MKNYLTSIISIIIIILLVNFISCTKDNEDDLLDDQSDTTDVNDTANVAVCNTLNMTYDSIAYIFAVCIDCHNSESTFREGVVMDSYENVKNSILTQPVWQAINHEDGFKNMPSYNPKLEQCELDKIGAWINYGIPE
ncbi:hypothetical protein ACFLTE_02920 [Bacteroidota bacterium]